MFVFTKIVKHGTGHYVLVPSKMMKELGWQKGTRMIIELKKDRMRAREIDVKKLVEKYRESEKREKVLVG